MSIHPLCIAAFAACCVGVRASAEVSPAPAPPQDASVQTTDTPQLPEPHVQVDVADAGAADLAPASPDSMQRLAADLALENLLLTRRLNAVEQAAAPGLATDAPLPDDLPQLEAAIAALEEQLALLRLHRAALTAASPEEGYASGVDIAAEPDTTGQPAAQTAGQSAAATASDDVAGTATEIRAVAEGSVPYRYRYSFGLIGHSGRGRVVLRGQNGTLRGDSYNFSEFRDDAVWVKLLFRNDGEVAQRFTGAMALAHRTVGQGRGRVRVLATVSVSTPVLQPGEIHEIDREIRVDAVQDVDFVEVGRVRSFSGRE